MQAIQCLVVRLSSLLRRDEEGASLIEYALLLALIAVVAIVAVSVIGTTANTTLQNVANQLP